MITEQQVRDVLLRHMEGTTRFIVDVALTPGKLVVEVDDEGAITINELAALNRAVREELGAAADDIEVQLGSPGAGRPFKVERQYHKHLGRHVDVQLTDGRSLRGELATYGEGALGLRIEHPAKVKGRPAKLDQEVTTVPLDQVQHTKATIKFN
jgi:ribosome maturation factor RimP